MMAVIIAIIAIVFPVGAHSSSGEGFLMRAVSLSGLLASRRTRSSGPVIPWVFIARPLKSKPKAAPLRSLPLFAISRPLWPLLFRSWWQRRAVTHRRFDSF